MARRAPADVEVPVPVPAARRVGRPSIIDDAKAVKEFLDAITLGNSIRDAALYAGWDARAVFGVLARGKKHRRSTSAKHAPYVRFFQQTRHEMAKAKVLLVGSVLAGGRKDPRLGLRILKARYPNEWNKAPADVAPPSRPAALIIRRETDAAREERLAKPREDEEGADDEE